MTPDATLLALTSEPVRGQRVAAVVAGLLSKAILEGALAPGTRLREEDLAATYGVSRTPVREALILLSGTGLVELLPNRGATVLELTTEDLVEIYHLRAVLESEAASLAARLVTPALMESLEHSCDRLTGLHSAPATEQLAADTSFHYGIADASGSPRLARLIRQVSAIPEAYRSSNPYTSDDMREAERQHRAIAAAIDHQSSETAAKLMGHHVHWAGELAVHRLEGRFRPS